MDARLRSILDELGIEAGPLIAEDILAVGTVRHLTMEDMAACGVLTIGKRRRLLAMSLQQDAIDSSTLVAKPVHAINSSAFVPPAHTNNRSSCDAAATALSYHRLQQALMSSWWSAGLDPASLDNIANERLHKNAHVAGDGEDKSDDPHIRPGSLVHHVDVARMIARMFGIDLHGGNVRLSKITQLFSEAGKNKALVHMSARTQMKYLLSAHACLVLHRTPISADEEWVYKGYLSLLAKRWAKDVSAGWSMGWILLAHTDMRVLINYALGKYGGNWATIPDVILQSLVRLVSGYATGRRPTELLLMVPVGMKLMRIEGIRVFNALYVWSKGRYAGRYEMRIMETDTLETNMILLVLMWCQRRGMIRSALDVYEFRETTVRLIDIRTPTFCHLSDTHL